jgi:hypothetical protein
VSPVKYELGLYIPEDAILHSHCRENRNLSRDVFAFSGTQSGDDILRRILKPAQNDVNHHREIAAQLADITRALRSTCCYLGYSAETTQPQLCSDERELWVDS